MFLWDEHHNFPLFPLSQLLSRVLLLPILLLHVVVVVVIALVEAGASM